MKKKTLMCWLAILAVCLAIPLVYMLLNRSTGRDATAEEIANHQVYAVDWSAVPGWEQGMTEKEFILNLSSFQQEKEIGSNVHEIYSSDVLQAYLYRCSELSEITLMNETVYITYSCEDKDMVILAYDDEGLNEMAVYDDDTDTMYHMIDGTSVVWNHFRNGFQFGS